MNHCCVIGRLVRDPDLRYTTKGTAVSNFRLARNERHGETERTLFVDVTAWGKLAETVKVHKHQGDQVAVSGRLHFDEYTDSDGAKHQRLSITAESIEFLAKKQNGNGKDLQADSHASHAHAPNTGAEVAEEEIPF